MIEYRVLGPLEVEGDDGPLRLGGSKQRALLALLLLNSNRVVSRDRLIDDLWGDDRPETAVATVQVYVSRLRKLLSAGTVVTRPPGYMLEVESEAIDLRRFERLVNEARHAEPERGARLLREALALWRGPPLAEFSEPFARVEAGRIADLRLTAIEARIEAELALGYHAELVTELKALIGEHPHREQLHRQLMLALYRCGRQAEAAAAYRDARAALDEVGIEPSEQLRQIQKQILAQDRALIPPRRRTNLRLDPTALVGRTNELADVLELVRAKKLVTLTGPGGSGKTRLAVEAAARLFDVFADGVWFISLASLVDPDLVEPRIAQAVGARGELNDFLRAKHVLLLLDNLEQLLPAVAPTVARLEATVLATSRERLNITAEHEYAVTPLPLDDALALFTQRARQLEPRFQSDEHVSEIARRLDGLPLAIELAAARVKTLTPQQIVERLGRSLDLLMGGARDRPERQRTLRATVEWSYQLLDRQEQALFARLAVFVGGCTLKAAEHVAGAELDVLQSLVEKNLLRHDEDRFWMLETIRELALEKLEFVEDAVTVRRRHAEYVLQFFAEAAGVDAARFARWRAEAENLRAAVEWAVRAQHADLALSLASLTGTTFTGLSPQISAPERARWFTAALRLGNRASPAVFATALAQAATLQFVLGDFDRVEALAQQSLDEFLALGDQPGQSRGFRALALAAAARGEHDRARERFERSLHLAEAADDKAQRIVSLHDLGELECDAGNLPRAAQLLEAALELAVDAGDTGHAIEIEHGLGDVARAAGDMAAAERHYRQALSSSRELSHAHSIAMCLAGLASLAASNNQAERAGRLWGASEAFHRAAGTQFRSFEQLRYEEALGTVAGPRFERAVNATRDAEPEEALAAVLADDI